MDDDGHSDDGDDWKVDLNWRDDAKGDRGEPTATTATDRS
jgi:hypothetical protein